MGKGADPLMLELADALENSLRTVDVLRDKVLEAKKGCNTVCLKVRRLESENKRLRSGSQER